jgi:hypothetical protein
LIHGEFAKTVDVRDRVMFKGIVTKIARDMWENAGKPAPEPAQRSQAPAPVVQQASDVEPENPPFVTDIQFPYYPGEGTACGASCRCRWHVEVRWSAEFGSNATFATWQTAGDDSVCPDCQRRAAEWQDVMVRVEPI